MTTLYQYTFKGHIKVPVFIGTSYSHLLASTQAVVTMEPWSHGTIRILCVQLHKPNWLNPPSADCSLLIGCLPSNQQPIGLTLQVLNKKTRVNFLMVFLTKTSRKPVNVILGWNMIQSTNYIITLSLKSFSQIHWLSWKFFVGAKAIINTSRVKFPYTFDSNSPWSNQWQMGIYNLWISKEFFMSTHRRTRCSSFKAGKMIHYSQSPL